MTTTIKISKSAIFELVMAGFEAYAVEHSGAKQVSIETGAHLWGKVNKQLPFTCKIEHVSVETSAQRQRGSLSTNPDSIRIKKDIARAFGMDYSYIGSAHTHPYLRQEYVDANIVRTKKLYQLSSADHICEINSPEMTVSGKQFSIELILTIHALERANDRKDGDAIDEPLIEFSLGNIKCWLYGRVFEHKVAKHLTDEEIIAFERYGLDIEDYFEDDLLPIPIDTALDCGIVWDTLYEEFGRLKFMDGRFEYDLAEVAESRW
ncbi:hypothetical protein ST37_06810 [Vibrio sp. qd031]|uniref:hypothetical protein n=1 Tax=Vibrio sp. qd031 TaxID=1603038 RepID=UPI000A10EB37|nr:hypothetical protein [Vibrio sp. qd031]ORT51076.1 hypothetical protein ST37_06810 [Vibrio sp. qd031]